LRRAALAGLAAALLVGCGGEEPREDPFTDIERAYEPPDPSAHAAPHWVALREASGSGSQTVTVNVDDDAIQWRVRWRCSRGDLAVSVTPRPPQSEDVRHRCPSTGAATFIGTGEHELAVAASGRWFASVEQQVDTPVTEPALPGMTTARRVARGDFEDVERDGSGSAALYRLPSGRLGLRFDDFVTDPNSDLFVWVSELARPQDTRQILRGPHRSIGALKATVGDQNYVLPKNVTAADVRSVVIWCEPVRIAYAAAPLR
jgi:electron transfer DM13